MLALRRIILLATLATAAATAAGPAALAQRGESASSGAGARDGAQPAGLKSQRALNAGARRLSRDVGEIARGMETRLKADD
ncbi:MAG TPA: hypothetical protein VKZ63_02625, partial [Kofleriaceae bacterium]|nr:hypothetical protein [Kofleriaceae bacterium]